MIPEDPLEDDFIRAWPREEAPSPGPQVPGSQTGEATLEATWWLFDEPSLRNLMRCGKTLEITLNRAGVSPLVMDGKPVVREARYELMAYDGGLQYEPGGGGQEREVIGWVEFPGGFPYGVAELLTIFKEFSLREEIFKVVGGSGYAAAPVPEELFDESYGKRNLAFNYLYLNEPWCEPLSDGQVPTREPKWFQRINIHMPEPGDLTLVPGEFWGLGVRLFPDKPWGDQETSPFISSGNWMDTVYYTTAEIVDLNPDSGFPFTLYLVRWRLPVETAKDKDALYWVWGCGFEEYQIGDRVTILKDITTKRPSQTWQDDQEFNREIWRMVPITFYESFEGNGS